MFQCEYGDRAEDKEIPSHAFGGFEELDLRTIQEYGPSADVPTHLQLNWNNIVLWRGIVRYPTNGGR